MIFSNGTIVPENSTNDKRIAPQCYAVFQSAAGGTTGLYVPGDIQTAINLVSIGLAELPGCKLISVEEVQCG